MSKNPANWLDRSIGWFSPERGLRRAHARLMARELLAYDAAKAGRRTDGWVTTSADADTETQTVVADIRNRSRDLVRNNPYASNAVDVKVTETIGVGIVAEVKGRGLAEKWRIWTEECDALGNHDFYGLQALIERCRIESGEVLIHLSDGNPTAAELRAGIVPLRLRVLEPDYLDSSHDGLQANGNLVAFGIEYDPNGQRVAYWLHGSHPGSNVPGPSFSGLNSTAIPARDIIHLYRQLRPGMTRGVSDLAPSMLRLRELDDYDDAEVMRKKVAACLAAFVTTPGGSAGGQPWGRPMTADTNGRIEQFYPAMIEYLQPGEDVKLSEPRGDSGYADFQRFSLRAVCAGIGAPYELAGASKRISGTCTSRSYAGEYGGASWLTLP
jgi:lambda family phage portal protein